MPVFTLTVEFDYSDLSTILEVRGQIAILKTSVITQQSVIWVALSPLLTNRVVWLDGYAVYASRSETVNGAIIVKMADQAAEPGLWYPFKGGVFETPVKASNIGPGEYGIRNQDFELPELTFGLAQTVIVNDADIKKYQPLNAQSVLRGQEAIFTPEDTIAVALMFRVGSGFVISEVPGVPTVLKFGGGVDSVTIKYNGETGRFVAAKKGDGSD